MDNLILIGYRGTGKTVLSRHLARTLHYDCLDTDEWIVDHERRSIPAIFSQSGEAFFRDLESKAVRELAGVRRHVIATGGGIIGREENRRLLREAGFVVWLQASLEVIHSRIHRDHNRPALTSLSPLDEIREVLEQRTPLYQECAHFSIDTGGLDIAACVREITSVYEKFQDRQV